MNRDRDRARPHVIRFCPVAARKAPQDLCKTFRPGIAFMPPQLEAPASPTPREPPQTAAEDAGGAEPRRATEGAQEAPERSWWRRWFG